MDDGGQADDRVPDESGANGTDENLSFGADVEQARAEPQSNGQPAKDIRRRGDQALQEGVECPADVEWIPALQRANDPARITDRSGEESSVGGSHNAEPADPRQDWDQCTLAYAPPQRAFARRRGRQLLQQNLGGILL